MRRAGSELATSDCRLGLSIAIVCSDPYSRSDRDSPCEVYCIPADMGVLSIPTGQGTFIVVTRKMLAELMVLKRAEGPSTATVSLVALSKPADPSVSYGTSSGEARTGRLRTLRSGSSDNNRKASITAHACRPPSKGLAVATDYRDRSLFSERSPPHELAARFVGSHFARDNSIVN